MKPINEQQQRLIDKYLQGRLSDSEERNFQQQIQDADFEAELRFQEGLQDAVQDLAKQEHPLKQLFQGEEKKIKSGILGETKGLPHFSSKKQRPAASRVFIKRYLSAAASVVVLAFLVYQLWPFLFPDLGREQGPSTADIQSFERPPQMTEITKSGTSPAADSMAIDCITLFKSESQYSNALSCFQNLNQKQATPETHYYIAQCYFKLAEYESAIAGYDQLLATPDLVPRAVQDQIRWNRMLAHLLNQDQSYQAELNSMVKDENFRYLREAMTLQEMLGG